MEVETFWPDISGGSREVQYQLCEYQIDILAIKRQATRVCYTKLATL